MRTGGEVHPGALVDVTHCSWLWCSPGVEVCSCGGGLCSTTRAVEQLTCVEGGGDPKWSVSSLPN